MQTAQLIKMMCAISNYPRNTMQTGRLGPSCCLEPFLLGPWAGWDGPALVGEQVSVSREKPWKTDKNQHQGDRCWAGLELGSAACWSKKREERSCYPTGGLLIIYDNYWPFPTLCQVTLQTRNHQPHPQPFCMARWERQLEASPGVVASSDVSYKPVVCHRWGKQNCGSLVSWKTHFSPKNI